MASVRPSPESRFWRASPARIPAPQHPALLRQNAVWRTALEAALQTGITPA